MLEDITLGSSIQVKVIGNPTSVAAAKTLARVLSKDETHRAEHKRHRKVRTKHFRTINRGGRKYAIHVPKQHPVKGQAGETGTIRATADVLADLRSVERFIEVSKG